MTGILQNCLQFVAQNKFCEIRKLMIKETCTK